MRVGAFTLQYLPEYASSSYDTLFIERAAITNIAASIAAGGSREAVGLEARGARWNASFYVSGGDASARDTSKQRGLVGRAVLLAVDRPGAQLQIGFDGSAQFAPGTVNNPDAITFSDFPELRGITRLRFLDTGPILTDTAYAIGPEVEGRAGPAYFEALYQHIGVDVTGGGSRSEAVARYSTADLRTGRHAAAGSVSGPLARIGICRRISRSRRNMKRAALTGIRVIASFRA